MDLPPNQTLQRTRLLRSGSGHESQDCPAFGEPGRYWSFGGMKRLCKYNGIVAFAFVLLWALLVVVEVKIRLFWFLSYIFFGSLPLVFVSFFLASWRALRPTTEYPAGSAGLLSLVLTPVFIFLGVTLVTNFKLMIGGHL